MSNRMQRADAEIQKAISTILLKDMNDPRFSSLITITSVKTTPDFKYSKIYFSVLSKDNSQGEVMLSLLKKSASHIRTKLCEMVRLPYAPFLIFQLDKGAMHSERINQILDDLKIPPLKDDTDERNNWQD